MTAFFKMMKWVLLEVMEVSPLNDDFETIAGKVRRVARKYDELLEDLHKFPNSKTKWCLMRYICSGVVHR